MRLIILLLSPILLLILFLIQEFNHPLFSQIIREDNLIEYSQFVILMITALFSVLIAFKMKYRKILFGLFLLIGLSLAFVAFEEISWGQRLLSIETPEYIENINVQKELTVHNLYFLHNLVGFGYIIISGYAISSWMIQKAVSNSIWKNFKWVSPPWYLTTFFLPSLIYNVTGHFIPIQNFWSWAEITELMLHLGLLLFMIYLFRLIPTKQIK